MVPTAVPTLKASASADGDGLQDLKLQLAAIPTKEDMEGHINRLESVYKLEIQALTTNLSQLFDHVQRLEGEIASVSTHQVVQDQVVEQHSQQIQMLFNIADDHENRNRRNNLQIRDVPESVSTAHILPTLKRLFNGLLIEE